MGDIESLGIHANNAKMITPKMCLEDCLKHDIGKVDAFKNCKKLIIIALDDTNGEYSFNFRQAGMKVSELIVLLSIAKHYFIRLMGF